MNSGICIWHISDHYSIFCIVSLSKSFHRVEKVTFIENFLSDLQITLSSLPREMKLLGCMGRKIDVEQMNKL